MFEITMRLHKGYNL